MNRRFLAAGTLTILLLGSGGAYWGYRGTPSYALGQIESAIEDGNRLRFHQYVDLDRFLPAAVDQLMDPGLIEQAADEDGSAWENLGNAIGTAFAAQMKPAIVQTLRRAILKGVEEGGMDGVFASRDSAVTSDEAEIDVGEIGASTGATPNTFAGIDGIEKEGDAALLGLRFRHDHLDTTLVLHLRMERTDRRWMIVAPEDLDSYMARVEQLRQAHLARLNEEQRAEALRLVRLGSPARNTERLFSYTRYEIRVPVTNVSDEPLHLRFAWLVPPRSSEDDRELLLSERDRLEPGDSTLLSATMLQGMSDVPEAYRSGDLDQLGVDLSLVVGEEGSARYVGPFRTWQSYLDRTEDPAGFADRILAARVMRGDDDPEDLLERADVGPWTVSEDTNPLDDTPIVTLINTASEGRSRTGDTPVLVLRCRDNRTEVFINWSDYLGSDPPIVSYRIGDEDMRRRRWSLSTTNRATFFSGSHIQLIREMVGNSRFVARVTPYRESPITAVFDLEGLEEHVVTLQEACNWS